jgi:hypothetical protein
MQGDRDERQRGCVARLSLEMALAADVLTGGQVLDREASLGQLATELGLEWVPREVVDDDRWQILVHARAASWS